MSRLLIFIFLAIMPSFAQSQFWNSNYELPVIGERSFNGYGNSLSLDKDRIIAGASRKYYNDGVDSFASAGTAYIYKRTYDGDWKLEQEIVNPDPSYYRDFGDQVAIHENTAFISSPRVMDTTRNCSRYSFLYQESIFIYKVDTNNTWTFQQRLTANDASESDGFGTDIEVHGKYLYVGAPWEDQDSPGGSSSKDKGSVYIFEDSSGVWVQKQKIFPVNNTQYARFGYSISVNNDYMWVGTYFSNKAFVFKRDSMGIWHEHQYIPTPSNITINPSFGHDLAVGGHHAVVSAPLDNVDSSWSAGSVYLYRLDTSTQWIHHQRLVAPVPKIYLRYGNAVALSDSFLVVGTPNETVSDSMGNEYYSSGAAFIYQLNENNEWVFLKRLSADTIREYSYFASDISTDNEHIVIGAAGDGEPINCSPDWTSVPGKTYVFSKCPSTYGEMKQIACSEYITPSGNRVINKDGIYYDTIATNSGCDSIIKIDLTVLPVINDTFAIEICSGTSYELNGRWLNSTGVYQDTLLSSEGCDSIITLFLFVAPTIESTIDTTICTGDPIPHNTVDTFTTQDGCDSIRSYSIFIRNGTRVRSLNDTLFAEEYIDGYQWLDCNDGLKPIPGEDNGYFIPSESGSYAVIIMDGMCIDTSDCYDIILTHTGIQESDHIIQAFPNPTFDKVIFSFDREVQAVNFFIFNALGKQVGQQSFKHGKVAEISLPGVSGVYYVHVLFEGESKVFRIFKI